MFIFCIPTFNMLRHLINTCCVFVETQKALKKKVKDSVLCLKNLFAHWRDKVNFKLGKIREIYLILDCLINQNLCWK